MMRLEKNRQCSLPKIKVFGIVVILITLKYVVLKELILQKAKTHLCSVCITIQCVCVRNDSTASLVRGQ